MAHEPIVPLLGWENPLAIGERHILLELMLLYLLHVSKSVIPSILCMVMLCFPWQLQYKDSVRSVQTSILVVGVVKTFTVLHIVD